MKQPWYIVLFFLFSFPTLQAQPGTYFRLADSAEMAVCTGQLDKAAQYYETSFKLKTYIHTQDLYNYTVLCIQNKQFKEAYEAMNDLVLRGFSSSFFLWKSTFAPFRASALWPVFMQNYLKNRLKFHQSNNWKLRDRIESLFLKDQYAFSNVARFDSDDRKNTARENLQELQQIIQKKGYPTDVEIGCFFHDDTTFMTNEHPLHILILHACQTKNFEFIPMAEELLKKGFVKPEQFMVWRELEFNSRKKTGYGIDPYLIVNGIVYQEKIRENIKDIFDQNRKSISACSYDNFCTKIAYQHFSAYRTYYFAAFGSIVNWDVPAGEESFITEGYAPTNYKINDSNN